MDNSENFSEDTTKGELEQQGTSDYANLLEDGLKNEKGAESPSGGRRANTGIIPESDDGLIAISTRNPEPEVTAVSVLRGHNNIFVDHVVPIIASNAEQEGLNQSTRSPQSDNYVAVPATVSVSISANAAPGKYTTVITSLASKTDPRINFGASPSPPKTMWPPSHGNGVSSIPQSPGHRHSIGYGLPPHILNFPPPPLPVGGVVWSSAVDVGGLRTRDRLSWAPGSSDVTGLQIRLDNMQRELSRLTGKNAEVTQKYQSVLGELESSMEIRRQLETAVEELKMENGHLRSEYDMSAKEKQIMQQQMIDMKLRLQMKDGELNELREQLHDLRAPAMSSVNSAWADNLLKQWEEVRKDNEALRQECELVREQHQLADGRIREAHEQIQIEYERRKAEEAKHRDERLGAYENLHKLAQERDVLRNRLESFAQQSEENRIEITRLHDRKLRAEEDLRLVRQTYDASRAEYQLVMSERDTVLKENQELAEEKELLGDKLKKLEVRTRALDAELRAMQAQRRASVEERMEGKQEDGRETSITSTVEQRSMTSSEGEVADITRAALEQEVTELRRKVDQFKQKMESNKQENEDARKRRDWAFTERERIVSERESMRKMCDQLRKERDDAITRLADAIKDSDDLQRMREKTEKELKDLKEKLDKRNVEGQVGGSSPSHSRDSAIDTDLAEWEVETLELNMGGVSKDNFGLELRGGRDDLVLGTTVPIYVKSVDKGSMFDNLLRIYDCIMQVNEIDVSNMDRRSVVDILHNSKSVKMVIKRRRLLGMKLISVPLDSADTGDVGLIFENGVYITKIQTSSPAAKAGSLAVGDRVIYVNDIPVHDKSAGEIQEILRGMKGSGLVLAVMKSPPVLSPMTPTASFPIGFNGQGGMSASSSGIASSSSRTGIKRAARDEGVQTEETTIAHHKSLLDKVPNFSKIFGKSEKRLMVKATASIPVQQASTDALRRGSSTRGSGAFSSTSVGGSSSTASRWWGHLTRNQGSQSLSSSEKQALHKENSNSPEQEQIVFRQFDQILEDEQSRSGGGTITNKSLAKAGADDRHASGGTWPKYRQHTVTEPVQSAASTITQRAKKGSKKNRPSVFPVFPQPISRDEDTTSCATPQSPTSSKHEYVALSRGNKHTSPHHGHPRPVSYHPHVSSDPSSSKNFYFHQKERGEPFLPIQQQISCPSEKKQTRRQDGGSRPSSAQRHGKGFSLYDGSVEGGHHPENYDLLPPPRGLHSTIVRGSYGPMQTVHAHPVVTGSPPPLMSGGGQMGVPPPPYPDYQAQARMMHGGGERGIPMHGFLIRSSPDVDVDGSRSSTSSIPTSAQELQMVRSSVPSQIGGQAGTPRVCKHSNKRYPGRISPFQSLGDPHRLSQGDVRKISIEKGNSCEYLGISIGGSGNGVFVSRVNENSLAARSGVQVGDQLLDVCGINMRNADLDHAKKVLRQFARLEEVTMIVQYNPHRYINDCMRNPHGTYTTVDGNSASSTPRATPNSFSGGPCAPIPKPYLSRESSMQSASTQHSRDMLGSISENELPSEPRFVFLKKESASEDWGFTLIGGNNVGVFVDEIAKDSPATIPDGLKQGDQILEFNGVNCRKLTLELAYFELQRQCDGVVSILAQHNDTKYQRCKRGAGDSFYVRVNVERPAENTDELALKFGDILLVDNSVFMGKPGRWRAWRLDQEGRPRSCGIIPSKYKLEEELMLKRSGSEISGGDGSSEGGGSRRGTIRRSLKFIRRSSRSSQHQRTPSKESKDLQDSGDPITLLDELYQRVERLDYKRKRPVLIFGALTEPFVSRLLEEWPQLFSHCVPECVKMPEATLNQGIQNGIYVDHRKRDKLYEVTTVAAVKAIMDKGFHCLLDVSPGALERLQRLQIYPVVVFVKFKQHKHVKELSEKTGEKLSSKQCREMMENADQIDQQLQTLNCQLCTVTATSQPSAEHTIRLVCQQIVQGVEHEQKKTLWIISSESL